MLITVVEAGGSGPAASQLGRSRNTVKNTLQRVYSKLGVSTAAQAILALQRAGQLDDVSRDALTSSTHP